MCCFPPFSVHMFACTSHFISHDIILCHHSLCIISLYVIIHCAQYHYMSPFIAHDIIPCHFFLPATLILHVFLYSQCIILSVSILPHFRAMLATSSKLYVSLCQFTLYVACSWTSSCISFLWVYASFFLSISWPLSPLHNPSMFFPSLPPPQLPVHLFASCMGIASTSRTRPGRDWHTRDRGFK